MLQRWGCAGPSLGHSSPQLLAARALPPCYLLGVSPTGPQNPPWLHGCSHPSAVGAAAAGNQPHPCGDVGGQWMQDAALVLLTSAGFGRAQSLPCLSSSSSPPSCTSAFMVFLHPRGSGRWFCSSLCPVHRGVQGEPSLAPVHGAHLPAAPGGLQ